MIKRAWVPVLILSQGFAFAASPQQEQFLSSIQFAVHEENVPLVARSQKLVREEFNGKGLASVRCFFAGKRLTVDYVNLDHLDYGKYTLQEIFLNNREIGFDRINAAEVRIPRQRIGKQSSCHFRVILSKNK